MDKLDSLSIAKGGLDGGFSVFPCKYGEKVPACWKGVLDATTNYDAVKKMFDGKTLNVGIATGWPSGVLVIDDDTYKGGSFAELEALYGKLPPTYMVRTRAGGRHFYFRAPLLIDLRCHNGMIHPHVDLRANGGYVLAAGSFVTADANGPAGTHHVEVDALFAELPYGWLKKWEELSENTRKRQKKKPAVNENALEKEFL
jgi:Bifunctional DNA primase/polymerase, N-terminal